MQPLSWLRRAWSWLTLDGHIQIVQPLAVLVGPVALAIALLTTYRWIFYVAYVYLLLVVVAYAWVRNVGPRVELRRRLRVDWVQVGDDLEESWELTNRAWLPVLWLDIADDSTVPGYTGRRIMAIEPDGTFTWTTTARCVRRGVYQLGPLRARLADPLGLLRYQWNDPHTQSIVIYPPLVRLSTLAMPQGQRGGQARADLLQVNATPSVGGLREYAPGDPPSRIHWPTVARTNRLMIKEFDQERAGALWIVLDLFKSAYPTHDAEASTTQLPQPHEAASESYTQSSLIGAADDMLRADSQLELAIVVACSLAAQALGEGRMVGLLANDGRAHVVAPGYGPRQLWQIMSNLVDVSASGTAPLGDLVRQTFGVHTRTMAGGALVVVTPALDGAWLPAVAQVVRARAGGAMALLVADDAAQSQPLAARLASLGIAAQTFETNSPLPLLHPPRKQVKFRVSPLGKVYQEAA